MTASVDVVNNPVDHATDLIIGVFFFAMRAYEYAWSSREGKTKIITLGRIKFFDVLRNKLYHDDLNLSQQAK